MYANLLHFFSFWGESSVQLSFNNMCDFLRLCRRSTSHENNCHSTQQPSEVWSNVLLTKLKKYSDHLQKLRYHKYVRVKLWLGLKCFSSKRKKVYVELMSEFCIECRSFNCDRIFLNRGVLLKLKWQISKEQNLMMMMHSAKQLKQLETWFKMWQTTKQSRLVSPEANIFY